MSVIGDAEFKLDGLGESVEIVIDHQGVPHIRAENADDLFFAQGWNAARDRLWQIDLWRKRGLGLLAKDFGPGYLEQDRASRLFLYYGDMDAEWAAYGDAAKSICTAFVAGINAFIDQIEAGEIDLPFEFIKMGTKPSRWGVEDVVRIRSHCLTRNALSEIIRANVLARGNEKLDALRRKIEPAVEPTRINGLDLATIPLSVQETFALATASVSFDKTRLQADLKDAHNWRIVSPLGDVVFAGESEGSNNWVIAPERTRTGRPIMASDPHRTHSLPSLRYLAHLTMPGLDVIGMGEPSVPGISLGHNEHIAYSLTIFGGDQEDVYVYDTNPKNPYLYFYKGGWEKMLKRPEIFEIKGHEAVEIPLYFTRHGPVLQNDPSNRRAYALRTVWSEPGAAPYMSSLKVMFAKNYTEYQAAMENWGTPSVNHIFADTKGTIAWHPSGYAPIRPNWNGLLPVKGDGSYEWQGFYKSSQMPKSVNPNKGFIATANEMNLDDDWLKSDNAIEIGYEWVEKSRSQRIHSVLASSEKHDLNDSCLLQNDVYSRIAERICTLLPALLKHTSLTEIGNAAKALNLFEEWDYQLTTDSSAAALFEFWFSRHVRPAIADQLGADAELKLLLVPYDNQSVLDLFETPEEWLGSDGRAKLVELIIRTLNEAWAEISEILGSDKTGWKWGDLHKLSLVHAIAKVLPEDADKLKIAPLSVGGGASSPNYSPYRVSDFGIITGPSIRLVMDVGAWDNSLFIALAGQSGNPESVHFSDMAEDWRDGRYHPLRYSKEAVDNAAKQIIRLRPSD